MATDIDTTVAEDTEQAEETKPRSLDVLLKLDTFQGMTDEEISAVVSYRESQAVLNAKIEEMRAEAEAAQAAFKERMDRQLAQAQANFEQAMSVAAQFASVTDPDAGGVGNE